MSSSVVIHQAGHGNTAQPAVTPTPSGMPPEIMDHILSFTPDSVRACRAVSRALRHIGEGFLQEHAQSVIGLSSDSSLYGLIRNKFAIFSCRLQSDPDTSYLRFHLSFSEGIVSMGVPGRPNRILSLQEIEQCNNSLQDINLQKIWGPLREQLMRTFPQPAGIPDVEALPQQIRCWMRADANQPTLQRISYLNLNGQALTCVPLEIRLCAALSELDLSSNQIASLEPGVFQGLTSLRRLLLPRNQIVSLEPGVFQGLTSLQVLNLERNQIASLEPGVFQGLTSLQVLNLVRNQIASLEPGVFQGLTSLESLSLERNQIASLEPGVFQGLTSLRGLYLNGNQIATLPVNVFQGLASLGDLFLVNNQIASLPANIFQGLPSLHTLTLYGNQRLLISYKDLPVDVYSNNIAFRDLMDEFFNYECRSSFAEFYQLVAGEASPEAVREAFSGLPDNIKNALYGRVWVEAGRPNTDDPQWGEHHTFDDMPIFYGALKRYVRESFGALNSWQKSSVYGRVSELAQRQQGAGNQNFADLNWGRTHVFDNILRLIDAMLQQEQTEDRGPGAITGFFGALDWG